MARPKFASYDDEDVIEIGVPVATVARVVSLGAPAVGVIVDYECDRNGLVCVRWNHTDTESWWPGTKLQPVRFGTVPLAS